MRSPKRVTVYFDPEIHKALRFSAAVSDRSISDVVNEAVKVSLAEDAEDLSAFDERKREPNLHFERFAKTMRQRSKLRHKPA